MNPIVEAIAPDARVRILLPSEISALKQFIQPPKHLPTPSPDVVDLGSRLNLSNTPFVKMEAINELTDMQTALLSNDRRDLRNFATTLNAPGGLERLGQIIAVDLFNGSTDRFYPHNTGLVGEYRLRCLVNIGNVFKVYTNGRFEVGALDFADPNSYYRDIDVPLEKAEGSAGANDPWPGRILADGMRRYSFAKDVVHDLEKVLNIHKSALSFRTKLNRNAPERIVYGMIEGVRLIKNKLISQYSLSKKWTDGVNDRYLIIRDICPPFLDSKHFKYK